MESNLLDRMLSGYVQDQTQVVITLQNKTRVHGKIKAFDSYVIIMDGQKHGIIYRHAISCVSLFVRQEVRQPTAEKAPRQPGPGPRREPRGLLPRPPGKQAATSCPATACRGSGARPQQRHEGRTYDVDAETEGFEIT